MSQVLRQPWAHQENGQAGDQGHFEGRVVKMEWRMLMPQPECRDCGVTCECARSDAPGAGWHWALFLCENSQNVENTLATPTHPKPNANRAPRTRTGFIPYSIKVRLYSVDASLFSAFSLASKRITLQRPLFLCTASSAERLRTTDRTKHRTRGHGSRAPATRLRFTSTRGAPCRSCTWCPWRCSTWNAGSCT